MNLERNEIHDLAMFALNRCSFSSSADDPKAFAEELVKKYRELFKLIRLEQSGK